MTAALPWLILGLMAGSPVVEGAPATAPATQPSADGPVDVVEVAGLAQARADAAQPWRRLAAGEALRPGASLRLGPKSFVRLKTADGVEVTLDRLGIYTISADLAARAAADGAMKHGRVRVDVAPDPNVRSPDSVLAVRSGPVEYDPQTGRWVPLPRPARPPGPATQPSTAPAAATVTHPDDNASDPTPADPAPATTTRPS